MPCLACTSRQLCSSPFFGSRRLRHTVQSDIMIRTSQLPDGSMKTRIRTHWTLRNDHTSIRDQQLRSRHAYHRQTEEASQTAQQYKRSFRFVFHKVIYGELCGYRLRKVRVILFQSFFQGSHCYLLSTDPMRLISSVDMSGGSSLPWPGSYNQPLAVPRMRFHILSYLSMRKPGCRSVTPAQDTTTSILPSFFSANSKTSLCCSHFVTLTIGAIVAASLCVCPASLIELAVFCRPFSEMSARTKRALHDELSTSR